MAGWPSPPPLSSFLPLSYASAAACRPAPRASARGFPPPLVDPALVLTAVADSRSSPFDSRRSLVDSAAAAASVRAAHQGASLGADSAAAGASLDVAHQGAGLGATDGPTGGTDAPPGGADTHRHPDRGCWHPRRPGRRSRRRGWAPACSG
jgi:hypothetical protein